MQTRRSSSKSPTRSATTGRPPFKPSKPLSLQTVKAISPIVNPFEDFQDTEMDTADTPSKLKRQPSKEEIQRGHILNELVETERVYLSDMKTLFEVGF